MPGCVSDDTQHFHIGRRTAEIPSNASVHHQQRSAPSPDAVYVDREFSRPKPEHSMPGDTFITYTHPSQQYDKKNRKKVASYIGTHYRNRSRPAARPALQSVDAADEKHSSAIEPVPVKNEPGQLGMNRRKPAANVHRDSHGLRTDPFTSYPIKPSKCIPAAIDYCKLSPTPSHLKC